MADRTYIPYAPDQMDAPVFEEPEFSFLEHIAAAILRPLSSAGIWIRDIFKARRA